jgi:dienelactone hydrolase
MTPTQLTVSLLVLCTLITTASAAAEHTVRSAQRVEFDSLDTKDSKPLGLFGWFFPAPNETKAPVIIALHGCGGLYARAGDFNQRHRAAAELLQQQGYHVLFPDSFNPRGKEQICTETRGTRDINSANRRRDVQGALQWAAQQSNVDLARIALLGWSHGGGTVLSANNQRTRQVEKFPIRPAAAIAFYPGCTAYANARAGYRPNAPLLLMIGEKDDWTPASSCIALHDKVREQYPQDVFELRVYPDSYHNFDAPNAPLRTRKDVPNGVHPGKGVTTGTNPTAREQAYKEMLDFLRQRVAS